jgi:hypothetical protein
MSEVKQVNVGKEFNQRNGNLKVQQDLILVIIYL